LSTVYLIAALFSSLASIFRALAERNKMSRISLRYSFLQSSPDYEPDLAPNYSTQ